MLEIRLSYLAVATLLLSGVSAYGAGSTFPSSVSEVPAFQRDTDTWSPRKDAHVGATGRVTPNAPIQSDASGAARRLSQYGWESGPTSTFPASPNESGAFR